jgi:hypothetical protein
MIPRQPTPPVRESDLNSAESAASNTHDEVLPNTASQSAQADTLAAQEEEDRVAAYLRGPTAFTA